MATNFRWVFHDTQLATRITTTRPLVLNRFWSSRIMTRSSMGLADSCCDGAAVSSSVAGKRSAATGGSEGWWQWQQHHKRPWIIASYGLECLMVVWLGGVAWLLVLILLTPQNESFIKWERYVIVFILSSLFDNTTISLCSFHLQWIHWFCCCIVGSGSWIRRWWWRRTSHRT